MILGGALVMAVMAVAAAQYDYCQLSANHTMCRYQGISRACGENSYGGHVTEAEKKTILDTHNRLRAIIASGSEEKGAPGPQPPAQDMQILEWDDELAAIAQRWADQCYFEHDKMRDTTRFSSGQNLFQSEGGVPWDQAILSWYSEVEFFDKNLVDNFIIDPATGHFTQMAWGNTRYIGCGKRTFPQNRRRFKRDTNDQIDPMNHQDHHDQAENVRQTRKIDYNNNRNTFNYRNNWNNQYRAVQDEYDAEWEAYNKALREYEEKYKDSLKNSVQHQKQIQLYKEYAEQARKPASNQATFNNLVNQHQKLKNIYDRQVYYDQKLKHKLATKKNLNPKVSKHYSFPTAKPIIAGVEYEYYVCNYGPAGNFPGARMYTKGFSKCPYYGLCSDPLTREYYPSLEIENDPILSALYSSQRK